MFIIASFISFQLLNGLSLGLEVWHTSSKFSFLQYLVSEFWYFFVQELFTDLYQELVRDS